MLGYGYRHVIHKHPDITELPEAPATITYKTQHIRLVLSVITARHTCSRANSHKRRATLAGDRACYLRIPRSFPYRALKSPYVLIGSLAVDRRVVVESACG